jgi:hypothetical protein
MLNMVLQKSDTLNVFIDQDSGWILLCNGHLSFYSGTRCGYFEMKEKIINSYSKALK